MKHPNDWTEADLLEVMTEEEAEEADKESQQLMEDEFLSNHDDETLNEFLDLDLEGRYDALEGKEPQTLNPIYMAAYSSTWKELEQRAA
jgi:hypothetical protein